LTEPIISTFVTCAGVKGYTIVILFLRGFVCFALGGAVGSSIPAPPRLRALLRDLLADANSFRKGDGCSGAFSLRVGVPGIEPAAPIDFLVCRGERRVGGDSMSVVL